MSRLLVLMCSPLLIESQSCCPGRSGEVSSSCAVSRAVAASANALNKAWLNGTLPPSSLPVYDRAPLAKCPTLDQLGRVGTAEAKLACDWQRLARVPNCTVISVGSENRWEFERNVFQTTSCKVHVFDCTGRGLHLRVPDDISSRVQLHLDCLGAPEWRYRDMPGGGKGHLLPRSGFAYHALPWDEVLMAAGLPAGVAPTYLKIDCEGCEQNLFRSLLASGNHSLLPDQIGIELHYPIGNSAQYKLLFKDMAEWPVDDMLRSLHTVAGFSVLGYLPLAGACCLEMLLARTRCDLQEWSHGLLSSSLASLSGAKTDFPAAAAFTAHASSTNEAKRLQQHLVCEPSPVGRGPVQFNADNTCMWDSTEFVLKASLLPDEDLLLCDFIDGYLANMRCFPRLVVIADPLRLERCRLELSRIPNMTLVANSLPLVVEQAGTFVSMQWTHLWLDNFTTAEQLVVWDVDSMLVLPLACHHLFDSQGLPFWYAWSAGRKSWLNVDNSLLYAAQRRGEQLSSSMSSLRKTDWMTFFPIVLPRIALPLARGLILRGANGTYFDKAWANLRRPSHYDIIGKAIMAFKPEVVHSVACNPSSSALWEDHKCNLVRPAEHLKHPQRGAHLAPKHLTIPQAHAYAQKLLIRGRTFAAGSGPLPLELFHYSGSAANLSFRTRAEHWWLQDTPRGHMCGQKQNVIADLWG